MSQGTDAERGGSVWGRSSWEGSFWEESLRDPQGAIEKYAELIELAGSEESQRRDRIRACARRWPGSLREGELVPVEVLEDYRRGLHDLRGETREISREDARRAGLLAPVLWSEIHPFLAALMGWRASGASSTESLREDLIRLGGASSHLREFDHWEFRRPCARDAYRCVAAASGLAIPTLFRLLLGRSGRWETHPEDPPGLQNDRVPWIEEELRRSRARFEAVLGTPSC